MERGGLQGHTGLATAARAAKERLGAAVRANLFRAGLFLQRESQKIVPVDTGALRASAVTRAEGSGDTPSVVVSYSADYAVYVHENLETRHKPGKTAKYLETPLREKRARLVQIVEGR